MCVISGYPQHGEKSGPRSKIPANVYHTLAIANTKRKELHEGHVGEHSEFRTQLHFEQFLCGDQLYTNSGKLHV